jgi:competence protein ComEA
VHEGDDYRLEDGECMNQNRQKQHGWNLWRNAKRGCLIFSVLVCCSACSSKEQMQWELGQEEQDETLESLEEDQAQEEAGQVDESSEGVWYVYVCGAVAQPGVYEVLPNARVYEVIELAGGLLEGADESAVNQARELVDGEQLYLPTKAEMEAGYTLETSEVERATDSGKVNVNTATLEELMTLPGIGETKARSILSYRETHGAFATIEDLMQVEGIKEGTLAKFAEQIVVK